MNIQEINFAPLFAWLNQTLGTEVDFSIDFSGKMPQITSPNLYKDSGIFKAVFKRVEVGFFGFWETNNLEGDIIGVSGNVNLFYEHWNGGSNGVNIGLFWFENGKWTFESERVRNAMIHCD